MGMESIPLVSAGDLSNAVGEWDRLSAQNPDKKYVVIRDGEDYRVVEKITCCLVRIWRWITGSPHYYSKEQARQAKDDIGVGFFGGVQNTALFKKLHPEMARQFLNAKKDPFSSTLTGL